MNHFCPRGYEPDAARVETSTGGAYAFPEMSDDYAKTFAAASASAECNPLGLNYRLPMPRPKVRGKVIDFHSHLLAAGHAKAWFEAADHYGIDQFGTMGPLEEAAELQRAWPGRLHFITVPKFWDPPVDFFDDWLRRLEGFYNLGSRVVKFHMAPGTMAARGLRFDSPQVKPIFKEAVARKMILMSHVGDPEGWYQTKYTDHAQFGTRDDHYRQWADVLAEYTPHVPWVGAHLGGNPEHLPRLQGLLDRFPNLYLDTSATRWIVREVSRQRDEAREFVIRNQDRLLFGSDQLSQDDRGFDFFASRFWALRKLWETAHVGQTNILDPDYPPDQQPRLHGLALPDEVLQKLYHDNANKLLTRMGATFD